MSATSVAAITMVMGNAASAPAATCCSLCCHSWPCWLASSPLSLAAGRVCVLVLHSAHGLGTGREHTGTVHTGTVHTECVQAWSTQAQCTWITYRQRAPRHSTHRQGAHGMRTGREYTCTVHTGRVHTKRTQSAHRQKAQSTAQTPGALALIIDTSASCIDTEPQHKRQIDFRKCCTACYFPSFSSTAHLRRGFSACIHAQGSESSTVDSRFHKRRSSTSQIVWAVDSRLRKRGCSTSQLRSLVEAVVVGADLNR
eukprot:1137847-Pelagomonas_calceolata.AAC.6